MTVISWIAVGIGVLALGAVALTEWRRYRWQKRNRRPGFVHPQGKKRVG